MANLAENQLMYNFTVDMLSRKFKGIKTVLTEAK
jgi:flagellar basal body rod protein FlgB